VIRWRALMALSLAAGEGHELGPDPLPVCSNRVIQEVTRRVGCTLGDWKCWDRSGGFCDDHVEARIKAAFPSGALQLSGIRPDQVARGDVAVFAGRAHYAYVEAVSKDGSGRPMAVDVSEYNFGTCWVDREALITDRFKVLTRRSGLALREVDGGFLRAGASTR
jgi:hypothetical protein